MKHYCTHSDRKYLAKGIALYRSLYAQNPNLKLWYLCTDEETFETLIKLDLPGIEPIALDQIEQFDVELAGARSNPASQFGDEYSQFCWTLTPYFIWWLMENAIPENEELLYCDADLYFYHHPKVISEVCSKYSVGIHQHKFSSYDVDTNPVGEFNVGCVFFRNNIVGKRVATAWKSWLLNPRNEYYEKYGTCGDQKYLDLFIPLFGQSNICVFDYNTGHIAHGAPWNFSIYEFKPADKVYFSGTDQLLLFNHFSHFTPNFENDSWSSSTHGEWSPEQINDVRSYYERYWTEIKESNKMIVNANFSQ